MVSVSIASEAHHNFAPSTISRSVFAIGHFHMVKGYHTAQTQPGVLIKAVLDDIRREKICGSLKKRSLTHLQVLGSWG
jgi:hypothetical protein